MFKELSSGPVFQLHSYCGYADLGEKLINLDFCLEKCPSAAYRRKLIFSLGMFYLYDHGTRLCMRVMK